jgi:integrase
MSLYYDTGSKLWRVQIQKHGRRISTTARTREEAEQLEAKYRRDLFLSRLGERPQRTIEEALLRWLDTDVPKLRSRRKTESHARALVGFVERRPIEAIGEAWADYRKAHPALSNSTLNRRGAILRRVANLAFRWGWTNLPLGRHIELLPENPPRQVYLTPPELHRLVRASKHQPTRDAVLIAAYAGLRLGEIMRLQPADIRRGIITVRPGKTGRSRPVPVHPEIRQPLARLPFPCAWRRIIFKFHQARTAAGLQHVRFHDLRHTNASWLIHAGADPVTVRDLLGHSSLAVTGRYSHLTTKHLTKAVRRLK